MSLPSHLGFLKTRAMSPPSDWKAPQVQKVGLHHQTGGFPGSGTQALPLPESQDRASSALQCLGQSQPQCRMESSTTDAVVCPLK